LDFRLAFRFSPNFLSYSSTWEGALGDMSGRLRAYIKMLRTFGIEEQCKLSNPLTKPVNTEPSKHDNLTSLFSFLIWSENCPEDYLRLYPLPLWFLQNILAVNSRCYEITVYSFKIFLYFGQVFFHWFFPLILLLCRGKTIPDHVICLLHNFCSIVLFFPWHFFNHLWIMNSIINFSVSNCPSCTDNLCIAFFDKLFNFPPQVLFQNMRSNSAVDSVVEFHRGSWWAQKVVFISSPGCSARLPLRHCLSCDNKNLQSPCYS